MACPAASHLQSGLVVVISALSWGLSVAVARAFSWGVDDKDALGALVVTGAMLGLVTGEALIWFLRQPVAEVASK